MSTLAQTISKSLRISGRGPLYHSRTFEFDPQDPLWQRITIKVEAHGDWMLKGEGRNGEWPFPEGTYTLEFASRSPQPLTRITIEPDPGGGRVP